MATEQVPASPLRLLRWLLWGLVAVAALIFAFLLLRPAGDENGRVQAAVPGFALGAPFTLTGTDGQPFSSSERLKGRPYAVFFGFTHCPDVCPNTLGRLARLRQQLGKGEEAFDIVFISVDPGRDTPAAVRDYVALFGTPIIGLTGSDRQVAEVAKSHAIYQQKVEDGESPGGYTVDHGAQVLLFGRDGKFVATIAQEEGDAPALDKLRRITA
jgi:protein SCO1